MKQKNLKHGRSYSEEASLGKDIYFSDGYFSSEQFISLAEQIRLVHSLKPKKILEIGIGNGLVSDFFRKGGFNITTVDINPSLNPDFIGSVTDLTEILQHRTFDVILCAEVLEHMPFKYFEQAINNIADITNKYAVLTLPISQKIIFDIQIKMKIPKFSYLEKGLFWAIPNSNIGLEHHWELDSEKRTKMKNIKLILKKRFTIVEVNRFRFRPGHNFFILKKRQ